MVMQLLYEQLVNPNGNMIFLVIILTNINNESYNATLQMIVSISFNKYMTPNIFYNVNLNNLMYIHKI